MVRKVLVGSLFTLALFVWGCSNQENGVAPQNGVAPPVDVDEASFELTDENGDIPEELQSAVQAAFEVDADTEINEKAMDDMVEHQGQSCGWNDITGPTVITEPGFYRVRDDFYADGDGIVVQCDWVFLKLGRHTITGPGEKMGRGVVVENAKFVVVKGGTLSNFGIGVVLDNSHASTVKRVKIYGEDLFADPANGIAPQIGIMAVNSAGNRIYRNEISMTNLGIFVRGGGSYYNRIFRNKVMGGNLGLLGICYNPDGSGDPSGPHGDFVKRNYLSRFKGGIQASAGAANNLFKRNEIKFFDFDIEDVDGANYFVNNSAMMIEAPMDYLSLNFNGLENLGSDFAYEGWLIVNGHAVTTGVFTVDGSGNPSQTQFPVSAFDLAGASKFVLTIEPSPDPDPAPAATHYLAGDFASDGAMLSVGDPAALGDDFMSAGGYYILNTPSTGSDNSDYAHGIWWLDPTLGPGPSLTLPTLPAGWVYEGWVVGPGGPVTTGQFTDVADFDFDLGGPTAGPDPIPPFPGQDYIDPPMNLIGYTAVISVEPYPDNSAAPFALKPLVDGVVEDFGIGAPQDMMNNAASFPTGSAMR